MNKQDVIQKRWTDAVGEKIFSQIKDKLDSDGWFPDKKHLIPIQLLFIMDGRFNDKELRPRTLRGISNNLGWSKPKEDGLPKKTGNYIFLCSKNVEHHFYLSLPLSKEEEKHYMQDFTHYKPAQKEPLPHH